MLAHDFCNLKKLRLVESGKLVESLDLQSSHVKSLSFDSFYALE